MGYYRDDEAIKSLGNRIKKLRRAKGISQEELANRCGLSFSQINRIENGVINTSESQIFFNLTTLKCIS